MAVRVEMPVVDLTKYCLSFPSVIEKDIVVVREPFIKHLRDMFSAERRVILIEGPKLTGKTTLVSQFAKYFCDRTISFFVGDDYWTSNSDLFLQEVCHQMLHIPGLTQSGKLKNINLVDLEPHKMLQVFNRLYAQIRSAARRSGPYYFVIDGVDKIKHNAGEPSILDLVPRGAEGIYIIFTATVGSASGIDAETWPVPWLSKDETEKILGEYFTNEQIKEIYRTCDGMPGYIKEIRRKAMLGNNVDDILLHLPSKYSDFLEAQWSEVNHTDPILKDIFALIVFSRTVVDVTLISQVLSLSPSEIATKISSVNFINISENIVSIITGYKDFVTQKLLPYKAETNQKLINFYKHQSSRDVFAVLPDLYRENDRYDELTALISTVSIVENVVSSRQHAKVRNNLRILSDMAFKHNDWEKLAWSSLAEATFARIAVSGSALESEVNALLSLNEYDAALSLAAICILPEDRSQLLAAVCNYMSKNSLDIPDSILQMLEDSIDLIDHTIELNEELVNKLLNVCTNILPIRAKLAINLLEKLALDTNGTKQNLLDFLLTRLLLQAGIELDSVDDIRSHMSNSEPGNLAGAVLSAAEGIASELILEQVDAIEDVPTKLFLLQSWCESNLKNLNSLAVVDKALRIMTESVEDSPTLSNLRRIAQPLIYQDDIETLKELVRKMDLLKDTMLKSPMDEYAWLELTLARIAKKWSNEDSIDRLYKVYFELDNIHDVDTRCYVLSRILRNVSDIAPEDHKLKRDIEEQMTSEYDTLLISSADQFTITKRLIATVTRYSTNLAIGFADKLNTKESRNLAYSEILRIYASSNPQELDVQLIERVLDKISYIPYKNWVLVQLIRRLATADHPIENQIKKRFVSRVQTIESPTGRAFGFAYYICWLHDDMYSCDYFYKWMTDSLSLIEPLTVRIEVGFKITELLAEKRNDFAKSCHESTVGLKNMRSFSDFRMEELYSSTCRLLLRTIPNIAFASDWPKKFDLIKDAIAYVPSIVERCELLANLALRCKLAGKTQDFQAMSNRCLVLLDQCTDSDSKVDILRRIGPMLFEYERSLLYEKIREISVEARDYSLSKTIRYILSKRPTDDPIDMEKFHGRIEFVDAIRVTEVVEHMTQDSFIYLTVSQLVDCILSSTQRFRNFQERQLLTVATRLKDIIEKKLPDEQNIQHNGYLIICQAELSRLRDLADRINTGSRANERWKNLVPAWLELQQQASSLSNVSDSVFVLATCGVKARESNEDAASRSLSAAEKIHGDIGNHIDRADRFQLLADSYFKAGYHKAAQSLIDKAVEAALSCTREEGRDAFLEKSAELAYSIDPALADSLISKVDSETGRARIRDNVLALTLHSNPSKVDSIRKRETKRVIHNAIYRVLESLLSGRGLIQHDTVIGKWMYVALGQDFDTINLVASWYVENSILQHRPGAAELGEFFNGTMELLEMLRSLGGTMEESTTKSNSVDIYMALSNVETYHVGQREQALETIYKWILENGNKHIKIYDPHFSPDDLGVLKSVPPGVSVTICTSAKTKEIEGRDLRKEYKRAWQAECDQVAPRTQVYVFHTRTGKTPMHNRYITSRAGGIELGTSFNGFGLKDSTIRFLDEGQSNQIEQEIIDPLIISCPIEHLGKRLNLEMFML
ncbi:MAG: P-loop domain-containing protein [Bacilli bacterium]